VPVLLRPPVPLVMRPISLSGALMLWVLMLWALRSSSVTHQSAKPLLASRLDVSCLTHRMRLATRRHLTPIRAASRHPLAAPPAGHG
jgi:hypothetical protein